MRPRVLVVGKILLVGSMLVPCHCCTGQLHNKPNIVFIMADDMGFGDVGCYNPESKIDTPNMDKLASEGMRFTRAHTPSSLCSPTRYGLLTGRYCWRTSLKKGVLADFYGDKPLIEKKRMTLASLLQEAGYETACIGKWHVGLSWHTLDGTPPSYAEEANIDFSKPVIDGPLERGFDTFYGTAGCSTSDPPYCFIENDRTVSIPNQMIPAEIDRMPGVVTGRMASDWSQEEVDIRLTEQAIGFIERHQQHRAEDPFFLYFVPSSPHIPWLVPESIKGKSDAGPRGDLVALVDWCVGQIMHTLEKQGLEQNTLVILTSDNGPRRGANGHKSAGNLRGYKGQIWEGGHRVPFIARWPGKIESGTRSDDLFSLTDMMASFSALVDRALPENAGEDSYNVLPVLLGKAMAKNRTRPRVFHSANGVFAIQQGQWILIQGTKGAGSGKDRVDPDSLMHTGQLYNLDRDPCEENDLWDQHPDTVSKLNQILERIKSQ
jgi:arylsulfatase A